MPFLECPVVLSSHIFCNFHLQSRHRGDSIQVIKANVAWHASNSVSAGHLHPSWCCHPRVGVDILSLFSAKETTERDNWDVHKWHISPSSLSSEQRYCWPSWCHRKATRGFFRLCHCTGLTSRRLAVSTEDVFLWNDGKENATCQENENSSGIIHIYWSYITIYWSYITMLYIYTWLYI
jgi:hypothetical protein